MAYATTTSESATLSTFQVPSALIQEIDLAVFTDVSQCRKTFTLKFQAVGAKNRSDFFFVDAQLVTEDGQTVLTEFFEIATVNTLRQARKAARYYEQQGEFTEIKQGFWCRIAWVEASWFGELITPDSKLHVCGDDADPRKCFEKIQKWVNNYTPVAA